jgi:hypothetical protein
MFVKSELGFVATAVVISTLSLTCVFASTSALDDSSTPLAALQAKADQAQPKDKCFLYAKLVSQMTDLAGHQLNSGDSGQASETLFSGVCARIRGIQAWKLRTTQMHMNQAAAPAWSISASGLGLVI